MEILNSTGYWNSVINEILSYLDHTDLVSFSLVSTQCEKIVIELCHPRLTNDVKWLANKPDFFKYFPQWKEVFHYITNQVDTRDLLIFVEGMMHFHQKKNYIFQDRELRQTTAPAHHPIHFAIVRRKYAFLKVLMNSPADFSEVATDRMVSPLDIVWQCGTSAQIFDLFMTNLEAKSIEPHNLNRALADAICNRDGYQALALIKLAIIQDNTYD